MNPSSRARRRDHHFRDTEADRGRPRDGDPGIQSFTSSLGALLATPFVWAMSARTLTPRATAARGFLELHRSNRKMTMSIDFLARRTLHQWFDAVLGWMMSFIPFGFFYRTINEAGPPDPAWDGIERDGRISSGTCTSYNSSSEEVRSSKSRLNLRSMASILGRSASVSPA